MYNQDTVQQTYNKISMTTNISYLICFHMTNQSFYFDKNRKFAYSKSWFWHQIDENKKVTSMSMHRIITPL